MHLHIDVLTCIFANTETYEEYLTLYYTCQLFRDALLQTKFKHVVEMSNECIFEHIQMAKQGVEPQHGNLRIMTKTYCSLINIECLIINGNTFDYDDDIHFDCYIKSVIIDVGHCITDNNVSLHRLINNCHDYNFRTLYGELVTGKNSLAWKMCDKYFRSRMKFKT